MAEFSFEGMGAGDQRPKARLLQQFFANAFANALNIIINIFIIIALTEPDAL